jgi:hypothetical protein
MVAIQSFHHSKIKLQGYGGYSKLSPQQNKAARIWRLFKAFTQQNKAARIWWLFKAFTTAK